MTLLLIVLLVLAIALVTFAIYNPSIVTVAIPFVATSFQVSISLLVTVSAALGAIGVGAVGFLRIVSLRVQVWNAETRAKRAERELERLRKEVDGLTAAAVVADGAPADDGDGSLDPGPAPDTHSS